MDWARAVVIMGGGRGVCSIEAHGKEARKMDLFVLRYP